MTELGWHEILIKAIRANQKLALKCSGGVQEFERLRSDYPKDGMIYYERGEAYEFREEFVSAEKDYREAEELFPLLRWKEVAREGLDRVRNPEHRLTRSRLSDTFAETLHRVHSVPHIPHFVRVDAFLGIARFYSHPYLAAAMLRIALERLVVVLMECQKIPYSEKDENLRDWINLLKYNSTVPETVARDMHKVRRLGNQGIHARNDSAAYDCNRFKASILSFVAVLESIEPDVLLSSQT